MKRSASWNRVVFEAVRQILTPAFCLALLLGPGNAGHAEPFKVAFFYNTQLVTDTNFEHQTELLLSESNNVELVKFPYRNSNQFCELYRSNVLGQSNRFHLVLGPSDSESLKSLDKVLPSRQEIHFLAPWVTTSPDEYKNIKLISAASTDRHRVREAGEQFLKYTAPRIVAVVHTDDAWGQGVARNFHSMLEGRQVVMHTYPVNEMGGTGADAGLTPGGSDGYAGFLKTMRERGVPVIVVALLKDASANVFLDSLNRFNNDLLIKYKPSILLLNEPGFHTNNATLGVLETHLERFNVFHVAERVPQLPEGDGAERGSSGAHADACRVVAESARLFANDLDPDPPLRPTVQAVLRFYSGNWPRDQIERLGPQMTTAYHRKLLGYDSPVIEVVWDHVGQAGAHAPSVASYFGTGYFRQFMSSAWFFMLHHRGLWHGLVLGAFILVSFSSFVSVVSIKVMKPFWLLLRVRAFWQLFTLNAIITYTAWVLSIHWGVFEDSNWIGALLLAAGCPTAVSAFGNMFSRFVPKELLGVVRILEELNTRLLERVDQSELDRYKSWLKRFSLQDIKNKFYEALFAELKNDVLRGRILDNMKAELDAMPKDLEGDVLRDAEKAIYIKAYLAVESYLSMDEKDLWRRLEADGFGDEVAPDLMSTPR